MKNNGERTQFQRFSDLAKAIVRVPRSEVVAQQTAARPEKPKKVTRPKA
jgi:hypothetical protein